MLAGVQGQANVAVRTEANGTFLIAVRTATKDVPVGTMGRIIYKNPNVTLNITQGLACKHRIYPFYVVKVTSDIRPAPRIIPC